MTTNLIALREALPPGLLRALSIEPGGAAYISGGSLVRSLLGLPCDDRDVDVWAEDGDGLAEQLRAAGYDDHETLGSSCDGSDRNVLTLGGGVSIDIVGQDYGSPAEVTARFDFRCAMVAWDGEHLWAAPGALDDIAAGRLVATRRTTEERIAKYEAMGLVLEQPREDVLSPEWVTWEQQFGREPLPVGGPVPEEPVYPEPPPFKFDAWKHRTWWVSFTRSSGTVEIEGDEDVEAVVLAELVEKHGQPMRIQKLPYPASPVLRRRSKCPMFCHSGGSCAGYSSCPKNYACSE